MHFKCEPTIPRDDAEAVRWYRLAAAQGDADAQNNLGVMYAEGQGVPRDNVAVHMWFSLATTFATHSEVRDAIIKLRDFPSILMSPAQIAEAQKLSREWFTRFET
ncbi:MAG: hypothetical protein CVT81_01420 [Alphaproteobacteria bacterium HGW-Alphaproteobacteria-3]|nr:MAG: hypothetical protein CVT81_01420 [Alphaproteobacteria bacterium HGW-Alphaproteobacteria-3]